MPLANNVPVFLDDKTGWNHAQAEYVNILVKTTRRKFESKAKQEKESKPPVTHLVKNKYGRVLDLEDYKYRNYFTLSFILNPSGFVKDGEYSLFDTTYNIQYINLQGSNSPTVMAKSLSALGNLKIVEKGGYRTVVFVKNGEAWPVDGNGNMVQYSVTIGGRTND